MEVQDQTNQQLDKVAELVKEIKFAMLTSAEADGTLSSCPMTTMQMDAQGNLWFFTGKNSQKITGLATDNRINLSYARIDKQDYLSVSGKGEVVTDREKMKELWTAWVKPWFPQGLDDPNLVLLKVSVDVAEYWDAPGSEVKRLYGLAKGILTGKTDSFGTHDKVTN